MDSFLLQQLPILHLARILAVATGFPILAGPGAPRMVRLSVSLALSCVLLPAPFRLHAPSLSVAATVLALPFEILVGLSIGYAFSLLFHTLSVAGDFLGQEMGLNAASQIDPESGRPVPLLARMFEIIGLVMFVELGGFGLMLRVIRLSFDVLPPGSEARPWQLVPSLTALIAGTAGSGVAIVLPAGLLLMVMTMFTTIAARVLPKLHIFYFAYAARMLLAVFLAAILLPRLLPFISAFSEQIFERLRAGLPPR